jgi:hypothetical protein
VIAMPRKPQKWIRAAAPKPGALHRQLGYPSAKQIPDGLLKDIYNSPVGTKVRGHRVTTLLKRRVVFAVNAQKRR